MFHGSAIRRTQKEILVDVVRVEEESFASRREAGQTVQLKKNSNGKPRDKKEYKRNSNLFCH